MLAQTSLIFHEVIMGVFLTLTLSFGQLKLCYAYCRPERGIANAREDALTLVCTVSDSNNAVHDHIYQTWTNELNTLPYS